MLALRLFGGVGAVFLAFFKIERGVGQNALFFLVRQLAHDLGRGADGSMILGSPAKVARELTEKEKASILANAALYLEKSKEYRAHAAKQA